MFSVGELVCELAKTEAQLICAVLDGQVASSLGVQHKEQSEDHDESSVPNVGKRRAHPLSVGCREEALTQEPQRLIDAGLQRRPKALCVLEAFAEGALEQSIAARPGKGRS